MSKSKLDEDPYFEEAGLTQIKLFDVPDTDKTYFTAFWRTIFGGTRLVCAEYGSMHYPVDLCCGKDMRDIMLVRVIYEKQIQKNIREGQKVDYGLLPNSETKPYTHDPRFMSFLDDLFNSLKIQDEITS